MEAKLYNFGGNVDGVSEIITQEIKFVDEYEYLKYVLRIKIENFTISPFWVSRRISTMAFFALFISRHAMMTFAFLRTRPQVVALPIPEFAPVMMNTFPAKDSEELNLPHFLSWYFRIMPMLMTTGRTINMMPEIILLF